LSIRKIKIEVLRPLILAIVIVGALFVLQFRRPIPPDIRREALQKVCAANLQKVYAALQQYQGKFGVLPEEWADLRTVGFVPESLELLDGPSGRSVTAPVTDQTHIRYMPLRLVQKGTADPTGPRRALVEFGGVADLPPATLYSDGALEWGR
jgi:hypothetical protein